MATSSMSDSRIALSDQTVLVPKRRASDVLLGEVKRGMGKLNTNWRDQD